jgi:hypothetical protein
LKHSVLIVVWIRSKPWFLWLPLKSPQTQSPSLSIFFEFSIFVKSRRGKTIKWGWKKLHKILLNLQCLWFFILRSNTFGIVGNPHRYLQFSIVAMKTSNFLPEFGLGKHTNFLKIWSQKITREKSYGKNLFVRILLGANVPTIMTEFDFILSVLRTLLSFRLGNPNLWIYDFLMNPTQVFAHCCVFFNSKVEFCEEY